MTLPKLTTTRVMLIAARAFAAVAGWNLVTPESWRWLTPWEILALVVFAVGLGIAGSLISVED